MNRTERRIALQRSFGLCKPCADDGELVYASDVVWTVPPERGGEKADNMTPVCQSCKRLFDTTDQ